MSKQNWRGGALTSPVPPVLVTCGSVEEPKVLTIAWTGTINTKPPKTYISVRPTRASYPILQKTGEFVINLAPSSLVRAVDYCGCKSGSNTDKFAECNLTAEPSAQVGAPSIAECPVSIECRVFDVIPLGSHDMFLADIVGIAVDEKFLDPDGKLRLDKADLLAYAHGEYYQLGKKLGTFGFSVRKKPVKKARYKK